MYWKASAIGLDQVFLLMAVMRALVQWCCLALCCRLRVSFISLSVYAMAAAETRNDVDDDLPLDRVFGQVAGGDEGLQQMDRREMPMMAVESLIFRTPALTWDSHSSWSGWPSRSSARQNVRSHRR